MRRVGFWRRAVASSHTRTANPPIDGRCCFGGRRSIPHTLVGFIASLAFQPTALSALAGFMNGIILVGCLQALDEDKRTWHDEWARTAVFRRIEPPSRPPSLPPMPIPR
jgi:hypothetical protein